MESAKKAVAEGAELLILDDGMQHRSLERDVEIVVLDRGDLFGRGGHLPLGLLRESLRSLKRADLLVVNSVETVEEYEEVKKKLEPYSRSPVVGMRIKVAQGKQLEGKLVAAFCGIAHCKRFFDTLKRCNAKIVSHTQKADHHWFSLEELKEVENVAQRAGAELLVCTEKDAVKFPKQWKPQLPHIALEIELECVFGKQEWDKCRSKWIKSTK